MAEAIHEILGGKVQLFQRPRSSYWQCRASIGGKQHQHSTKKASLAQAKDVAEDWFLTLTGKVKDGELKIGKTFKQAADRFLVEFEVITEGERSPRYVANHKRRLENHLIPFFGSKVLSEITSSEIQDYRVHRIKNGRGGKRPSRSTLHQEMVCLRQTLKTALRHNWITHLPDMSAPYKSSGKVSRRAWFSHAEYQAFYEATGKEAANPRKERWQGAAEDLHDYVLFMANTGLRPDEAQRLEYRDVEVIKEPGFRDRILHIEVRGKRGVGYCKSMPGAVQPFLRMQKRHGGKPDALIFPASKVRRTLFNTILTELGLKTDREGQVRTAYSLRHTYICLRLIDRAEIYALAKNCRISVEMIQTFYADHIKHLLDVGAINVRSRTKRKAPKPVTD